MSKDQLDKHNRQSDLKMAVISGSLLFLFGILMWWGLVNMAHISLFWPGLTLGFLFTLLLPYWAVRSSKQQGTKAKSKKSMHAGWGGLGAGLGILILGIFREHEALMTNITAAATSLLLGMGFFSVALAIWKRNKGN